MESSLLFRPHLCAKVYLVFAKKYSCRYQKVSFNILREICVCFAQEHFLPAVDGLTLSLFDVKTRQKTTHRLESPVESGTAQCVISSCHFMIVGGCVKKNATRRLHLLDFTVEPEESMSAGRAWPGVCLHEDYVWVFGGFDQETVKSSERFSLTSRKWTAVPSMSVGRMSFSPCAYEHSIYLLAPSGNNEVEILNTVEMRYRRVNLKLYLTSNESVAFVHNKRLVVLLRSLAMYTLMLEEDCAMEEMGQLPRESIAITNGVPVKKGNCMYWVTSTSKLVVCQLGTYQTVAAVYLEE